MDLIYFLFSFFFLQVVFGFKLVIWNHKSWAFGHLLFNWYLRLTGWVILFVKVDFFAETWLKFYGSQLFSDSTMTTIFGLALWNANNWSLFGG